MVGLTPDEGNLLASALSQWGGPASPTDELAVALGFADAEDLVAEAARLADAFRDGASLAPGDIERALVAAEVVFISDTFGAGVEWETVTGLTDEETLRRLRAIQRKIPGGHASR